MPIPSKSRLAYAWNLLGKKDVIYSNAMIYDPDPYSRRKPPKITRWLEAAPVAGHDNAYKITEHYSSRLFDHRQYPLQYPLPEASFTRDEALEKIQAWETRMLQKQGFKLRNRQPFSAFIETNLSGRSGSYDARSVIVPRKAAFPGEKGQIERMLEQAEGFCRSNAPRPRA